MLPITILIIYIILFTMFNSAKWAALTLANVSMASIGGIVALMLTGTHFSVSIGVGFLALFGVSVQVGVIMIEYINHLRARGYSIGQRFRPTAGGGGGNRIKNRKKEQYAVTRVTRCMYDWASRKSPYFY